MNVGDVMTRTVVTVPVGATFKDIVGVLLDHDISAVPVIDEEGFVIGIVTESDLVAKEAFGTTRPRRFRDVVVDVLAGRDTRWAAKARGLTAGEVMTPRVSVATPDEDLHTAARRMLNHSVKRLVVLQEGRLVGIVSRNDLLRVFAVTDSYLQRSIERFLRRGGFIESGQISVAVRGGIVTLDGNVPSPGDVRILGSIVAALDGVVAVVNDVRPRESVPERPARSFLVL